MRICFYAFTALWRPTSVFSLTTCSTLASVVPCSILQYPRSFCSFQKLDDILDAANATSDDEGRSRVKKLMGRIKELGKRLGTIANHAGRVAA
jgi:hypothetical protein